MTLPVVWIAEAKADLEDGVQWYETARSGLGEVFVRAVAATVEAIAANPRQLQVAYRGRRRAGYGVSLMEYSSKFSRSASLVLACFHGKRNPKHWQSR